MSRVPADPPPYAGLDPAAVMAAVESLGLACDGRVFALNSYENRVFRVGLEDGPPLVAKFYRPERWSDCQILEEHEFALECQDAELPVVAPLVVDGRSLHRWRRMRFALFPLQGGQAPEPGDEATLERIGRTLGRLHGMGAIRAFRHRPRLDIAAMAREPANRLLRCGWIPESHGERFSALCARLLEAIDEACDRAGNVGHVRLHGDCHFGNLLWRDGQVHLLDLDDALSGPAVQDLWMLVSGDADERGRQLGWLLRGYEVFRPLDRRELHLVEALRAMRLLHFHGWIAHRWHDPAFPAAFPWFAMPRHWEGVLVQLHDQVDALREPAPHPP